MWWRNTPMDPDGNARIGCVGRFECVDVAAGVALLHEACGRLAAEGVRRIVGPMDGDTWHAYRLVSAGWDGAPRFFLEPWNSEAPVRAFEGAGFAPWARYSSSAFALAEPEEAARVRHARLFERLESRGVSIRGIRMEAFEEELGRLFELSSAAFAGNFLYTPIAREEFLSLYELVRPLVNPAFVRFAEKDGRSIGFVFALPDVSGADAGRLIVKTLAVHPDFRHLGLGTVLVDEVQEAARAAGFHEVIHALQHETNSSLKITGRHAGVRIREYTLYQRPAILP
jgi:GNAT superfamily N-acetyltransferase